MSADLDLAPMPLRGEILRLLGSAEPDLSVLDAFLAAGTVREAATLWFGEAMVRRFADTDHLRRMLDREICEIDELLNRTTNIILHNDRLQQLEADWRGVYWLTASLGADGLTVLRILDCRWNELARDLERAAEFDQSALFDLVYNQEFGMPGGLPYSLLIGLYEVQHRPTRQHATDDVAVLRRLSAVAAAAFAPFLLGATPAMFGVDKFIDLDRRATLAANFRTAEYTRFNSFRALPDSRFIGLVCPKILLRAPYRERAMGDCGFRFTEIGEGSDDQVWGVGSLAVAQICLRAFNDYRWLAAIRGTVTDELAGGLIVDLATPDFETDAPMTVFKFPLEVNLSEGLERDLAEAGFICVRRCKDTPYTVINNLPSAHHAKGAYVTEIARVNEQLGAMLNYVLCVSRFAHYVKVIARDWIGSFMSPEECQRRLNSWLSNYCSTGDDMSFDLRARYPLEAAHATVRRVVGQPGSFECTMMLKPHLQLDQAISEFQLVTVVQGVERAL